MPSRYIKEKDKWKVSNPRIAIGLPRVEPFNQIQKMVRRSFLFHHSSTPSKKKKSGRERIQGRPIGFAEVAAEIKSSGE